jgi:cation diffusion facilitator CzcD-associated flavoprotein CzcO
MPDSVVVIGCGPGGMFFCHALETKRREMIARGESVANLPHVTVFERAGSPGGVWRSQRSFSSSDPAEEKKEADPREPQGNTQMVRSMEAQHCCVLQLCIVLQ